ncbi:MAG: DUF2974 domain-containing protein [Coriobacteriia bacterium]|nr:DUF2974 domain-containing protein [Coriobacteriia bacterium]
MAQAEENIVDYLGREFRGFDELPLSDVDSLVLACLSYYRLPDEAKAARTVRGAGLHELFRADWFAHMTEGLWDPAGLVALLTAVVASPRLRGVRLASYVSETSEEQEKQFAACTLRFPNGDAYVSFRGTDNSLVGWKEDFNMAFETGVPSQLRAVQYLERAARSVKGRIYVGGHSKGGNLAVYAAAHCKPATFERIERVFSHDGPGFTAETLASADYAQRCAKLSKTVPESSLIGMMFEQQETYAVVRSTSVGATQHDPFSWVVEGDAFAQVDGISRTAGYLDQSLNQWICSMTREERAGFVNALFSVLYAGGQDTLAGLKGNLSETLPAMFSQLTDMDEAQRGYLVQAVSGLVRAFAPDVELPSVAGILAGLGLGADGNKGDDAQPLTV